MSMPCVFPAIILVSQQYHCTTCISQSQPTASSSNNQQVNGSNDQEQLAVMRSLVNNQSQIIKDLQRTQNEHEEEISDLQKQLKILTDNRGESN